MNRDELLSVLRPFAEFAAENSVADGWNDGWTDTGAKISSESICDHFSSDDFIEARRAYEALSAEGDESIDLSLLPKSDTSMAVFWKLGNDGEGGDPALFKATVLLVWPFSHKQFEAVEDTPALAFATAARKAQAEIAA